MLQGKHSSRGAIEEFIIFSKSTLEDTAAVGAPGRGRFLSRYTRSSAAKQVNETSSANNEGAASVAIEVGASHCGDGTEKPQCNLMVNDKAIEDINRKASLRKRLGECVPESAYTKTEILIENNPEAAVLSKRLGESLPESAYTKNEMQMESNPGKAILKNRPDECVLESTSTKNKSLDECDLDAFASRLEQLQSETEDNGGNKANGSPNGVTEPLRAELEACSSGYNVENSDKNVPNSASLRQTSHLLVSTFNSNCTPDEHSPLLPTKSNRTQSFPPYHQSQLHSSGSHQQVLTWPSPNVTNFYPTVSAGHQFLHSEPTQRSARATYETDRMNIEGEPSQFQYNNQWHQQLYSMGDQQNVMLVGGANEEDQFLLRNHDSKFGAQTLGRRQMSSAAIRKSEAFKRRTRSVEAVDGYRAKSSVLNSTIDEEPDRPLLGKCNSLSIEGSSYKNRTSQINGERRNFSQSIPSFNDSYEFKQESVGMSWMNTRSLANIDENSRYEEVNFCNLDRVPRLNSKSYGSSLDQRTRAEQQQFSTSPYSRISPNSYSNVIDGVNYTTIELPEGSFSLDPVGRKLPESSGGGRPSQHFFRKPLPDYENIYSQPFDAHIYEHTYSSVDGAFPSERFGDSFTSTSLKNINVHRSYERPMDDDNLTKSQNVIVSRYTPAPNLIGPNVQYTDPRYKYLSGPSNRFNFSVPTLGMTSLSAARGLAYSCGPPQRMTHAAAHQPAHQQNYIPQNTGGLNSYYPSQPSRLVYSHDVRSQNTACIPPEAVHVRGPLQYSQKQTFYSKTNPLLAEPYAFHSINSRTTPLQEAYHKRAAALGSGRSVSNTSQPQLSQDSGQLPASILVRKDGGGGVTSELFHDSSRQWRGDVKFAPDPLPRMGEQHFRNNRNSNKQGRKVTLVL